jgi:hypothetical protein
MINNLSNDTINAFSNIQLSITATAFAAAADYYKDKSFEKHYEFYSKSLFFLAKSAIDPRTANKPN